MIGTVLAILHEDSYLSCDCASNKVLAIDNFSCDSAWAWDWIVMVWENCKFVLINRGLQWKYNRLVSHLVSCYLTWTAFGSMLFLKILHSNAIVSCLVAW